MHQSFVIRDRRRIFCRESELLDHQGDARIGERRRYPISRVRSVTGGMRPHKGPFPEAEAPLNVLGMRASNMTCAAIEFNDRVRERERGSVDMGKGGGERRRGTHRYIEINDMIFRE